MRVAPASLWGKLFSGTERFPELAGRTVHFALAHVRPRADGARELILMQCARVSFDPAGAPVTMNMSLVALRGPCLLEPEARPEPRATKFSQEPHYWFPDAQELARMAEALAPRPDLRAEILGATLRTLRAAPPPHLAVPHAAERRAQH
ncbi:hypothetical protein [Desulfocurvus sp. DL9XJH121]